MTAKEKKNLRIWRMWWRLKQDRAAVLERWQMRIIRLHPECEAMLFLGAKGLPK